MATYPAKASEIVISVVIPLYNKAETIERALHSVLEQNFRDIEVIVVDDGSTDSGADVVRACKDARVRLIQQENAGVAAARNAGIRAANCEWVALLDADDWWLPEHLTALISLATNFPDAVLCGSAYWLIEPNGGRRCSPIPVGWGSSKPDMGCLTSLAADAAEYGLPICASSVMCSRSALLKIGGFPLGVSNGEDWMTWLSLSCSGDVAYVARPNAIYEEPAVLDDRGRLPQRPDLVRAHLTALMALHVTQRAGLRSFLALWHRMRAVLYLQRDERLMCMEELVRAIRLDRVKMRDVVSAASLLLPSSLRLRLLARKRLTQRARKHLV